MFCQLFLYEIVDWICKKIPVRNGERGGGQEYVCNSGRGRSKRMSAYDGGRGSDPCHFNANVIIE